MSKDLSYGPLARALFDKAVGERHPLWGMFELTHRCNLACVHCYVNLPAADRAAQKRELTTEQAMQVLGQLADAGVFKLTLTGGEPLLRGDFPEIYRHAYDLGLLLTVYTNAVLITPKIADLFEERRPVKVEVTQYGATAGTYERVVDAPGDNFGRFHRGVGLLRDRGIPFELKTMALRDNAHEVPAMEAHADELGVSFRFDAILSPRIDGGKGPLAQRLSPAEVTAIEERMRTSAEASWERYCSIDEQVDSRRYTCGAGNQTFTIDPYGRLHVCELSRTLGWNVLESGFAAGWTRGIPEFLAEGGRPDSGCASCALEAGCSNCAGMAELERRPVGEPDVYFCEVTDGRYKRTHGDDHPPPRGLRRALRKIPASGRPNR